MESAIYWTEFAGRTSNYTFKTPASSVPFYQYIYLDVIAVLGGITLLTLSLVKIVFSLLKTKPHQTKKMKTK